MAGSTGGGAGSTGGGAGSTGGGAGSTGGGAGSTGGDAGSTGGDAGSTGGDAGSTGGDAGSSDGGAVAGEGGYDPRYFIVTPFDAGSVVTDSGLPWQWAPVAQVLGLPPTDGGLGARWVPVWPSSTGRGWAGGVLLFDGGVVAVPFDEPDVLVIHPADDTSERIPVAGGAIPEGWEGGVLLPDGTVLAFPRNAPRFLRIDTAAKTATLFGDDLSDASDGGLDKFRGGVLGLNGLVYAAPSSAAFIARLDPATGHVTRVPLPPSSTRGDTQSAVLFPTGDIVMFPASSAPGLLVVPSMSGGPDTVWYLARPPSGNGPAFAGGGVITGVGTAVAPPQQNALVLHYDRALLHWTTPVPGLGAQSANSYFFGAWSTDGHVWVPGFGVDPALRLGVDPTAIGREDAGSSLFGSVLGAVGLPDGRVIGIPHGRSAWLELAPEGRRAVPIEAMTSPFLDKL